MIFDGYYFFLFFEYIANIIYIFEYIEYICYIFSISFVKKGLS